MLTTLHPFANGSVVFDWKISRTRDLMEYVLKILYFYKVDSSMIVLDERKGAAT